MPVVRKRLVEAEVYPDDIRYQPAGDQVERLIDGVWTPAPESDPRRNTTLPPRATADPRCDGAQSIADALENQISQILTAIDNAQTLATIAGLILGLLSFGVFAIFINIALAIAGYMLDAGTAAISASLPPTAFDQLACILYCHMNDQGRIKPGDLPNIYQDIVDQISLPGAQVLISMLELAGEGGLNNLASLGTATGDCDECGCSTDWCYLFPFTDDEFEWTRDTSAGDNNGDWVSGQGWNTSDFLNVSTTPDTAIRLAFIKRNHASTTITKVILTYNYTGGTYDSTALRALIIFLNGVDRGSITRAAIVNGTNLTYTIEGEWSGIEQIAIYLRSSRDTTVPYTYSGSGRIISVQMEGTGTNPFGTDNC
jgi:hypothetical protein